jgi:hypothetical protein
LSNWTIGSPSFDVSQLPPKAVPERVAEGRAREQQTVALAKHRERRVHPLHVLGDAGGAVDVRWRVLDVIRRLIPLLADAVESGALSDGESGRRDRLQRGVLATRTGRHRNRMDVILALRSDLAPLRDVAEPPGRLAVADVAADEIRRER